MITYDEWKSQFSDAEYEELKQKGIVQIGDVVRYPKYDDDLIADSYQEWSQ